MTSCAARATKPLVRRAHGSRPRPVLLGDEARVAAHGRRRHAVAVPRVRDRRLVDPLEPHRRRRRRRARHGSVERVAHVALRHRRARVVRRAVRPLRRAALLLAGGAADQRSLRRHRPRRAPRGSQSRWAGSPATSRPRCSVRHASPRDEQEHLRHRVVRAREPRQHPSAARRRPAHDGGVGPRRQADLRARRLDLRHRRRDPVAARRSRDPRRRRGGRPARRNRARHRRGGVRPRVHRARLSVLGPVRTRRDARPHPWDDARARRACRDRGDGVADRRRRRRDRGRDAARASASCASTAVPA